MKKRMQKNFVAWTSKDYPAQFTSDMGIYVHIPFCQTICPFCPYLKTIYDTHTATQYLHAVENELRKLHITETNSIYIGGGTPTLLKEIFPILAKINRRNEFAVEILPSHLDEYLAKFLVDCNVNYISIGLQSMNDSVLKYLKRPNTSSDNRKSLKIALKTFEFVDVDLIFDVINFDTDIALNDFRYCIETGVGQISTYPLMRFGFTPFGKSKHNHKLEHYVLNEMQRIANNAGYQRRSVWTFTRNENHYSSITRKKYFGIGAGAATYTGDFFWINTFDINKYISRQLNGKSAVELYTTLTGYKKILYEKFWELYNGQTNSLPALFSPLRLTGHIRKSKNKFILTQKGYNLYHDIEQWVTYNYIEPLWKTMYSLADPNNNVAMLFA